MDDRAHVRTVQVAEFTSTNEAHIALGMLRAHGIDARLRLDDAGGNHPQLAARSLGGSALLAPEEQYAQARALLADVDERLVDDPTEPVSGGVGMRPRLAGRVLVGLLLVVPVLLLVGRQLGSW